MKKKFSRILGVGLAVALLTSLMMVATPASAVSSLSVSFAVPVLLGGRDDAISTVNPHYIIQFVTGSSYNGTLTNATITVSFPSDTSINATSGTSGNFNTIGAATIAAGEGWYGTPPAWTAASLSSTNWTYVYDTARAIRTVSYTLNPADVIGSGAAIRIDITKGLINPSAAGTYTLSVSSSWTLLGSVIPIELPVSTSYSISPPFVAPLGGLVQLYNSQNVLMDQALGSGKITTILTEAGGLATSALPYTVTVGPGSYVESPTVPPYVTLKATGTAAATTVTGCLTMSANCTCYRLHH